MANGTPQMNDGPQSSSTSNAQFVKRLPHTGLEFIGGVYSRTAHKKTVISNSHKETIASDTETPLQQEAESIQASIQSITTLQEISKESSEKDIIIESLQAELAEAQQNNIDLEHLLTTSIQSELALNDTLVQQMKNLEKDNIGQQKEISVRSENSNKEVTELQMHERLQQLEQKEREHFQDNVILSKESGELIKRNYDLEQELKAAQAREQALEKENNNLRAELRNAEETMGFMEKDFEDMQNSMTQKMKEAEEEFKIHLEDMQHNMQSLIEETQRKFEDTKETLEKVSEITDVLARKYNALHSKHESLKKTSGQQFDQLVTVYQTLGNAVELNKKIEASESQRNTEQIKIMKSLLEQKKEEQSLAPQKLVPDMETSDPIDDEYLMQQAVEAEFFNEDIDDLYNQELGEEIVLTPRKGNNKKSKASSKKSGGFFTGRKKKGFFTRVVSAFTVTASALSGLLFGKPVQAAPTVAAHNFQSFQRPSVEQVTKTQDAHELQSILASSFQKEKHVTVHEVYALQKLLVRLGFNTKDNTDGIYANSYQRHIRGTEILHSGSKTQKAVYAFQKAYNEKFPEMNIAEDGQYGKETLEALQNWQQAPQSQTVATQPVHTSTPQNTPSVQATPSPKAPKATPTPQKPKATPRPAATPKPQASPTPKVEKNNTAQPETIKVRADETFLYLTLPKDESKVYKLIPFVAKDLNNIRTLTLPQGSGKETMFQTYTKAQLEQATYIQNNSVYIQVEDKAGNVLHMHSIQLQ